MFLLQEVDFSIYQDGISCPLERELMLSMEKVNSEEKLTAILTLLRSCVFEWQPGKLDNSIIIDGLKFQMQVSRLILGGTTCLATFVRLKITRSSFYKDYASIPQLVSSKRAFKRTGWFVNWLLMTRDAKLLLFLKLLNVGLDEWHQVIWSTIWFNLLFKIECANRVGSSLGLISFIIWLRKTEDILNYIWIGLHLIRVIVLWRLVWIG